VCGQKYGVVVCKELCAVQVLNASGSGSYSGVIAGIDFVAGNCGTSQKCVANMSLGGGNSEAMTTAVNDAVGKGITFVVAAGNSNANACDYSPASADRAITVGAIDMYDGVASFTNWGICVDIYSPGVSIKAAWRGGADVTKTISGTSMASPHVCALAAAARQDNEDPHSFLKGRASKVTIDCRSPETGVSVNPNLDCSTTLSAACPLQVLVDQPREFNLRK
jgi:serine protease